MLNRRHTVGRRLRFNMLILDLQQLVFSKLFIGCQLQFRSVFRNSILKSLVRKVSTEVRQEIGWHLRQYNYLKDILRVTGVALFFQSSELLASFVSILVHRHRNLLKHLGNLRQLISGYLLTDFKDLVSLKIGVFGKIMGEQSRRFRRYLIFYGAMLKERTVNHSLNYTIVKTYNVYGGFCIRV